MQQSPPILSNLQLELLKLYANQISEAQLHDIKLLLANYFAQQATIAMEQVWEQRGLTEQDMTYWTHEHHRLLRDLTMKEKNQCV